MKKIDRREAIHKASLMIGGTISASLIMGALSGCEQEITLDWTPLALSPREAQITADLADRILPATTTPGAKEAQVERFIDKMVAGYLTEPEKTTYLNGLAFLDKQNFIDKTPQEQDAILIILAGEAKNQSNSSSTRPFFLLAKEMTLLGFFTSEIGATQVLNYDPVPGEFRGCVALESVGGKTWAS